MAIIGNAAKSHSLFFCQSNLSSKIHTVRPIVNVKNTFVADIPLMLPLIARVKGISDITANINTYIYFLYILFLQALKI